MADTFPVARPAMLAPLAAKSILLDIVNTGQQLLAVGTYGHILTSRDGKKWEQVPSPISSMINRVPPVARPRFGRKAVARPSRGPR